MPGGASEGVLKGVNELGWWFLWGLGGVWKAPEENQRKRVREAVKSPKLLIIIEMIKAGKLS